MKSPGAGDPARIEFRCDCGNLLLKLTPRGLEVKCKRCKRIQIVPLTRKP